jgi:hypothetical protein
MMHRRCSVLVIALALLTLALSDALAPVLRGQPRTTTAPAQQPPDAIVAADGSGQYRTGKHCYVKRQPNSTAEMEKAIHVIRAQELDCVRYRGTDGATLRRLAEAGEAHHCDHPPADIGVVLRTSSPF